MNKSLGLNLSLGLKNMIKNPNILVPLLVPTQDKNQPKAGFLSKWVYNFLPAQNLALLLHHIGGGQLPKNMHEIL
jgi:hypothetical protein